MASHRLPSTLTGLIGQQQTVQGDQQERQSRNPGTNETIRAHLAPSRGSYILSSILRGPLPGPRAPNAPNTVTGHTDQGSQTLVKSQGQRSVSPVRIITIGNSGMAPMGSSLGPVDPKSLSPSRISTTLPPKKSLSPSRPVYSPAGQGQVIQHRVPQASPPQRDHHPAPMGSVGSAAQGLKGHIIHIPRSAQGEIPQAGLQQIPANALFQQYVEEGAKEMTKGAVPEGFSRDMIARAEQAVNSSPKVSTQVILERDQTQPKPAHQTEVSLTPPPQVSAIRRTPSPAHMPIGADVKPVRVIEGVDRQQAVNLSRPHERHPSGGWIYQPQSQTKPQLESRMSEEFKYSDLLQSLQRSQVELQSQLLQRNLSPITPSDPLEPTKPWQAQQSVGTGGGLGAVPHSFQSQLHGRIVEAGSQSGAGQQTMVTPPGGFIPIPVSGGALPVSSMSTSGQTRSAGLTQVVFPSPGQSLASPKAQRVKVEPSATVLHRAPSPKTRVIQNIHNPASSAYTQSIPDMKQPVVNLIRLSPGQGHSQGHSEVKVKETVRVFPGQDRSKYNVQASLASVTQPGPPNVTITTTSSIFPPEKSYHTQTIARNPFTFPPTPPVSLANELAHLGRNIQSDQSKISTDSMDTNQKQRHRSDDMPHLHPVSPRKIKQEEDEKLVPIPQPYNMRLQILANLPNNSTYRPTYRATSVAVHRAKAGCITSAAKSLDILRQNLQKSMNKEIDEVIQRYLDKFFKVGIENIKLNNGENCVSEEHVQAVCRQILEEAKKMYITDTGRQSVSPARELSDNVSEAGSSGRRSAMGKRRHPSDTDSETNLRAPGVKKKKGRHLLSLTGRATPSKLSKDAWKREGPKYDPERLVETTRFVMGSKANKAMGFGATRGRLYMKHPDLFKYNGDQDDKTWLYEHHHMPATGGKSYLVILEDIKDLAESDEYKDQAGVNISDIQGFTVPSWMIEKMKHQMLALRTDLPKLSKHRSRSVTPIEATAGLQEGDDDFQQPKELPFANFSSPKASVTETSNTDEDLEFLADAGIDDPSTRLSPFNMTGGFDDAASDIDTLDDGL